jgi:DNA replication and repair protein RecF
MILKSLTLKNFRNYKQKSFDFDKKATLIVGPNTAGKSNLIESIIFLSTGKSFRTDKDEEVIEFGQELLRIKGKVQLNDEEKELEVVISNPLEIKGVKKYLLNGVAKRRSDFAGNLTSVLFSPEDLDIIIDSPGLRRRFMDHVLEQVDHHYRLALTAYVKGLRQRNALLEQARETGHRNEKQLEYWDNLLIENGELITKKREEFLNFVNLENKEVFDFTAFYDKSIISKARLLQYKDAEIGAGVTLVGPHRDDFSLSMFDDVKNTTHDIKLYGSRGQQRLAILQLKLFQLLYIQKILGFRPVLLLDDIFSELDEGHIELITSIIDQQQTIITTTHKDFLPKAVLEEVKIIQLK